MTDDMDREYEKYVDSTLAENLDWNNAEVFEGYVLADDICQGSFCAGNNPAEEMHPCPYSVEIHDDSETLCNCCDDCSYECAMEI